MSEDIQSRLEVLERENAALKANLTELAITQAEALNALSSLLHRVPQSRFFNQNLHSQKTLGVLNNNIDSMLYGRDDIVDHDMRMAASALEVAGANALQIAKRLLELNGG